MAFSQKFGGLMKQAVSQNGQGPMTYMLNSIRCLSSKIFVGGISWGTDERGLRDAFSRFGEVVDAKVITDRETGRSRGFGFVEFAEDEAASSAVSTMDGQELDGRNIRVDLANDRRPRPFGVGSGGSGGGYGGGGRGDGGFGGGDGGY